MIKEELKKCGSPEKAKIYQRFFKTGPGQYGEGDIFLGCTMPEVRGIVKEYSKKLSLKEAEKLIYDKVHEVRMAGLLILVDKFEKGDEKTKKEIYDFYIQNAKRVNNWDLVDLTAHKIVGAWILDKPREILYKLARSDNLWERRISVIATFTFFKKNDFKDSIKLAEFHLKDKHDLMHKAVGWMLREVGKRDVSLLRDFLKKHSKVMPRTMLRYSIEKFDEAERKKWLEK